MFYLKKYIVMKIKSIILAALAFAASACSTDNNDHIPAPASLFEISGTQIVDDTRVAISDGRQVSWVEGDQIFVRSSALATTATAVMADGATARFRGEGEPLEQDTYYATYPATEFEGTSVEFNLANQSGAATDAAILVGADVDAAKSDINLEFKPVNSLLYVVADFTVASAQFSSFNGAKIADSFSYDFTSDSVTMGEADADNITLAAVNANSFFISLPAGLDMSAEAGHDGYILTLTNQSGEKMIKAYDGKLFEGGKTTTINIAWSKPTVTIGAHTSYSYYDEGNKDQANSCANNVIYFSQDSGCAMTYSGIQNAFVSDLEIVYGGTTYKYSEGSVMWDKSTKSFSIANQQVSALGAYSVEARVITTYGETISASKQLYITGLPYTLNPAANDSFNEWTNVQSNANVGWNVDGSVRLGYNLNSWGGSLETSIQKSFNLPANVNCVFASSGSVCGSGSKSWIVDSRVNTTFTITASGSDVYSVSSTDGGTTQSYSSGSKGGVMKSGAQTIILHNSYSTASGCTMVKAFTVTYGNK